MYTIFIDCKTLTETYSSDHEFGIKTTHKRTQILAIDNCFKCISEHYF